MGMPSLRLGDTKGEIMGGRGDGSAATAARAGRGRWHGRRLGVLAVLLGAAVFVGAALADQLQADGDTSVPPGNISYTVGGTGNSHLCTTRGTPVPGSTVVTRSGATHFTAGETVTVTPSPDAAGVAAGITSTGGSVSVPSPWNTNGQTFSRAISTTVPSTAGDGTYTIDIVAVGVTSGLSLDDEFTVTVNCASPTVRIDQAAGQADPTNASPINFTVVFSETVSGFTGSDVTLSGTAGATTAVVTGGPSSYNVAVSGMTGVGTVVASIAANRVTDANGNGNSASTSTDNTVTYDNAAPTVTINQASGQADPTNTSPIAFRAVFSEPVAGFSASDVSLSGTAGATTAVVTGGPSIFDIAVSGMTTSGTVIAAIPANAAVDAATNGNTASTSTDNTVSFVSNSPPVVTAGDDTFDEGTSKSYSASWTDSGGAAQTHTCTIDFGDGGGDVPGTVSAQPSASGTCSANHTYADGLDSHTIEVSVDDGITSGADTATATVDNVAPTIALTGADSVDEGSSYSLTLGTITDPGSDTVTSWVVHWGDSSSNTYSAAGVVNHTYADGPASPTITVDLVDEDGTHAGAGTKSITVDNVAPVLTAITAPSAGALYAVNATVSLAATFTDAGTADTHTCYVDWDVAAGFSTAGTSVTESNGSGTCNASRSYGSTGVYTIKVKLRDDDGAYSNVLEVMVVVFDPSAGFVTGGGWITSPAGAYAADASLTGKANFGFVSKYKKGAAVPEGQTEFQLHFASFNFQSTSYQWLVVSANGTKAQYKGNGTVNGTGSYGFLLTAYDEPDKFRIKIWSTTTSAIVYDNRIGSSEDIDAADPQAIAGGSIVIHTPKK